MFVDAIILAIVLEPVISIRPQVKIQDGKIRGIEMLSFKGRPIFGFYNIPYTQRLTRRRRFEELRDADPWEGILDAGGPPVRCPQVTLNNELIGVENCLFINVFTPLLPKSSYAERMYPVVVYFHGGAYYFYSGGVFGPRYLLDKNVVFVSFNYRIGIPGFGSTEDYVLPGNLGMKDQVKALTWIQRNIHYFSGDRNSVTLLGMSAGATSVHLHYFSKKSKGLFHRGVMIGGMATEMWAMYDRPRHRLERMSEHLGCPTNSSFDMVACLEGLPPRELAMGIRTIQDSTLTPLSPVSPLVDDFADDPFLLDYPYDALAAGRVAKLPMLVSNAEFEGIFPGAKLVEDEHFMRELDENWLPRGKSLLELDHVLDAFLNGSLIKIRKYYFGSKPMNQATEDNFIKMLTDRYWHTNSVKATILHARTNPRVYYYLFGYKGRQSTSQLVSKNPGRYGAAHVDDLYYMINVTDKTLLEVNATDILMIERLTTMLASFAKNGHPDFGTDVDFRPVERSGSIHEPIRGLLIRSPNDMKMTDLDIGNVKFWDSLPIMKLRKTSYYRSSSLNTKDNIK